MKINISKPSMVEFGELAPGDVFVEKINGEELVQMKIDAIAVEDDMIWNCVSLDNGTAYYTKPTKQVCRVSAELNIL